LTVGSYPDWFNNYYKVKVLVESANKDATDAAVEVLKQSLPNGCVLTGDFLIKYNVAISLTSIFVQCT